jgi:repressor LexA
VIGLTSRQRELLAFIQGYQEAHGGVSPSFREMRNGIASRGQATITDLLDGLEERGFLRRLPNRVRAIEILSPVSIPRSPEGEPLFAVPGVGG